MIYIQNNMYKVATLALKAWVIRWGNSIIERKKGEFDKHVWTTISNNTSK